MERRLLSQLADRGLEQIEGRQLVAGAREKQHRNLDLCEMLGPFYIRPPAEMKRERKQDETRNILKRLLR